jgi:hypothetical protein
MNIEDPVPARFPTERRPLLFAYLKIAGLGEWSEKSPVETVSRFHRALMDRLHMHCSENDVFKKVLQFGNVLVFPMDHVKAAQISVWRLFEAGFVFGSGVLRIVSDVQKDFACELPAFILLFKCVHPEIYASQREMAVADWIGDVLFLGSEHILPSCVNGKIHVISARKEPNTTKWSTGFTSSGQKFDIYIMV